MVYFKVTFFFPVYPPLVSSLILYSLYSFIFLRFVSYLFLPPSFLSVSLPTSEIFNLTNHSLIRHLKYINMYYYYYFFGPHFTIYNDRMGISRLLHWTMTEQLRCWRQEMHKARRKILKISVIKFGWISTENDTHLINVFFIISSFSLYFSYLYLFWKYI